MKKAKSLLKKADKLENELSCICQRLFAEIFPYIEFIDIDPKTCFITYLAGDGFGFMAEVDGLTTGTPVSRLINEIEQNGKVILDDIRFIL